MIDDKIKKFENWAIDNGWTIERAQTQGSLPEEVADRYQNIPKEWFAFISNFQVLTNRGNLWFLTYEDYLEGEWSYNEFENISLNAAEEDEEWKKEIEAFWDNVFPILFIIGGDYQYYGIEMSSGKIVWGWEPEFEEVTYVAESFTKFLEKIISGEIVLVI